MACSVRLPSLAENLFVQLHPLIVLVERDARVHELERQLVERRVDSPVRRHEVALREDLLAFLADMPFFATISLKSLVPLASPISSNMPASQSESSCSMPSLPFHFGSSRSSQVFGRSCFLTDWVLYACTNTFRRVPTHSP